MPGWDRPGVSGGLLERREAGCWPRATPLRPPRRSAARFRRGSRNPHGWQQRVKRPAHAGGCELVGVERPFPRQAAVGDPGSRQPQLRVGGPDQPGPAVGLLRVPHAGRRPAERLLAEAQRVLQVEAADVGAPEQAQVRLARAGPPQPERPRLRVWRGRRSTSTSTSVPRSTGRALRVPRSGCACCLGWSPPHARTRTTPYCSSSRGARPSGPATSPGRRTRTWPRAAGAARPSARAMPAAGRRRSNGRRAGARGSPHGRRPSPASTAPSRNRRRRQTGVRRPPPAAARPAPRPARRQPRSGSRSGAPAARPAGRSGCRGRSRAGPAIGRPSRRRSAGRRSGARGGRSTRARGWPRRRRAARR